MYDYRLEVVGPEPAPRNDCGESSENGVESDVRVLVSAKVKNNRAQHEHDQPRRRQWREPHQHVHEGRKNQAYASASTTPAKMRKLAGISNT